MDPKLFEVLESQLAIVKGMSAGARKLVSQYIEASGTSDIPEHLSTCDMKLMKALQAIEAIQGLLVDSKTSSETSATKKASNSTN